MNLKRKLMAIAAFVLASALPAAALEYNDGKITWNYVPVSGTTNEVCLGDGTNACISAAVEGAITLPDVIGGKRVTTVADNAFKGCTKVTSISILENLETIEEGAFDGATSLKTFGTLNRNECFFSYKGSLYAGDWEWAELVRVPPALEAELFEGLVKPQVCFVWPDAFRNCAKIKKIAVNAGTVENGALYECSFAECTSFDEFVWESSWEWDYWDAPCVKDGALYEDPSCCHLLKWPTAKPLDSFESMKLSEESEFCVADGAFAGNPMEKITIPAWAWIDSSWAFAGCANLKEISFLGSAEWSCAVLYELEDAGINLQKVVYPGFPKGMAEDWEGLFEYLKEEYGGCYSNIVYEKTADPNLGKANITIPYTDCWNLFWKYDFEAYAKDLTTLTFEGPCSDEFVDILEVCSNVTKVVYSANPLYRDYDVDWMSWKSVIAEFEGSSIAFVEGAAPAEPQWNLEDGCLYGTEVDWDETTEMPIFLPCVWPAPVGEMKVPDGVYDIGEGAFYGLDQVTKLVLPRSMAWGWIDEYVGFETMSKLAEIEVDFIWSPYDDNPWYYSENGCLCNCDGQLVRVPPAFAGELKIPEGVYEIGEGAFCGLDQVTKLVLPSSIAYSGYIDENAGFETMSKLAEIEVVGERACEDLEYYSKDGCLYYGGQLFRVPLAYMSDELVIEGDYPYWNAVVGCKNIKKLTMGNPEMLECVLWGDFDLTGCDQLVEFACNETKWERLSDYGYAIVDGAIYEDWDDGELCLLLWPNGKLPIVLAENTVSVDCDAFRYLANPAAVTELTVPKWCDDFDLYGLAGEHGVSNVTKLVFKGCSCGLSVDLLEVMPKLSEIVYSPDPHSAEEWEWMREEFAGTAVKFTAETPSEPIYGYELDVWDEDDYGNPLDGECYLGYEGYPFVYPALKGAYEIPERIENCRVVWAFENAFADMGELTELTFPQGFWGFDAGTYRKGCWNEDWEWVVTGEVDIVYSPFVGCTSLSKLTFKGYCPEGLWEVLEVTPSVREVYYNDFPWSGESGWIWRDFIAEFKAEHPESAVQFVALPAPEEPIWSIEDGELYGEYEPETGWRVPCVWPDLVGEAEIPAGVYYVGENAFACMSGLTALTIPASVEDFDVGTYREGYWDETEWAWVTTGEVDIVYSPFVGCTSLTKLTFKGYCPEGLWEVLEVTPSIREVYYNDFPWSGESGWIWRDFIAEFKAEHPESAVQFVALPAPEEPVYNCELEAWDEDDDGNILDGECYLGRDGYPFVYPALTGAYEIPERIENCRVVYAYENAFADMGELTELTFPQGFWGFDAGVQTSKRDKLTGERIPLDPPRPYSPFVGCTSLSKLTFKGYCPEGLWEVLELTPSIREVYYNDFPWSGESGWVWRDFIAEFKAEHPESAVQFVALPAPEEPVYNCELEAWDEDDDGNILDGECYLGRNGYPFVYPALTGAYEIPERIENCRVVYAYENAFADMGELTELTFPQGFYGFDAGTYREGCWNEDWEWVVTGEVDIVYSPFVGCTSLKKLVFLGGTVPDGMEEVLELTPSIEEVIVPSWKYRSSSCDGEYNEWLEWFVMEYKENHPDSTIVFKKDDGTEVGKWDEWVPWKVEGDTMTVDWWAELDEGVFDGVDLSAVTRLVLPPYLDYVGDGVFGALTNLCEVEAIFTSDGDEATYFGSKFGEGQRLKLTIKPEIWWECDCELCESEDEGLCPICKSDDEWGDCDENCGCPGHWEIEDFAIQSEQFENAEWIETLVIEEPAFAIGDYAFAGCVNLKSVTIPASVEWMGEGVFAYCEKLEKVSYGGNAPYGCVGLYNGASSNLVSYVKYGTTGWTGVDGEAGMPSPALWPVWEEGDVTARPVEYVKITETGYAIVYLPNGGAGEMDYQVCDRDKVYNLTKCTFKKSGKAFKGWAGSNGKRYDDGVLIFNAAAEGKVLTLTAIWE